jgi:hypothetical protein
MRRTPFVQVRRGAALACCLAAFVSLAPGEARAALGKHNFTGKSFARFGACSACHIPHFGDVNFVIWPRSLFDEWNKFDQRSAPNYAPRRTITCYDCHDNHDAVGVGGVDDDPPDSSFGADRKPQDVAFDEEMNKPPPPYNTRDGRADDNKAGYYENVPSDTAGYPVTGGGASTFVSGHYIKNEPGVGSVIEKGDKLPCSDCHDAHLGYVNGATNQAFIRGNLGGRDWASFFSPGKKASLNMSYVQELYANDPDAYDRDSGESRVFCIACHGTSEQATYKAVTFKDINPTYGSNYIAAPPVKIAAHKSGSTTACTNCHRHNGVSASCSDCHGFPPMLTQAEGGGTFNPSDPDHPNRKYVENYSGGAGAHKRHLEALGESVFFCEICHGPDPGAAPWHNEGSASITDGSKVNIMGLSAYWDPAGNLTTDYVGTSNSPPETPTTPDPYEFSKQGGGNQRCVNLTCHGAPPNVADALNWTDKMVDNTAGPSPAGDFTGADGANICKWCHDATPARIGTGPWAPNVMGDGTNWGADVSGHGKASGNYDAAAIGGGGGLAAANRQCTACHDARYGTNLLPPNSPAKTHFNGTIDRIRDTINGLTVTTLIDAAQAPGENDAVCRACHQNGATGTAPEGTDVSTHGNHYNGSLEGEFARSCRQCHDVHGANWNGAGRNLHMIGRWVDSLATGVQGVAEAGEEARVDSDATGVTADITAADRAIVFTSRTGADSFDENDGAYDPVNDTDDVCATCHAPATGGGAGTGGGAHNGTSSPFEARGDKCTDCHGHEYDNNPATIDGFGPSGCEGCHDTSPYVKGSATAPNVMGNGTLSGGNPGHVTPKPYDDGTYGFNVNGHGRDVDTAGISKGNPINKGCTACHDVAVPAGTHMDGTLNGRLSPDTRNANSFHLNSSFIAASLTNQWDVQVTFDAACSGPVAGCHTSGNQMRHALDAVPAANAVEFGQHESRPAGPSNTPPPTMFYDRHLTNLSGIDTTPNYALCVTCHDPHGTGVTSPRADGNNKMMLYRWANPSRLCTKCHK